MTTKHDPADLRARAARAIDRAIYAAEHDYPGAAAWWSDYALRLTQYAATLSPQTTAPVEVSPPRGDL